MKNFLFVIFLLVSVNIYPQKEVKYIYTGRDSTLTISGKGWIQSSDVNKYSKKCVRVIIKEGIEGIQFGSFLGFRFMKEIQLPNTLQYIGKVAFSNCSSLKSVKIPPKVKELTESFIGCDSLRQISFSDSIYLDLSTLDKCGSLEKLSFNYLIGLSNCYFVGCKQMEYIEVKDSTGGYYSSDGVLYCRKLYCPNRVLYPPAKKDKCYVFSDTIKEITILQNPYIEEIHVSDDIRKINLLPCENLKLIKSNSKIYYDRRGDNLKMDSLVIQKYRESGHPMPYVRERQLHIK